MAKKNTILYLPSRSSGILEHLADAGYDLQPPRLPLGLIL
jgi:hypothetical protein